MNKDFKFEDVFSAEDSIDPGVQMLRLYEESEKRCRLIRKRTGDMEKEFLSLIEELKQARSEGNKSQIKELESRLGINRDLRETLYKMWRRNL